MKRTLNTHEMVNELLADSNANWSRAGAFALIEHLEELESDTMNGTEEMDFDVVAIRCEFSEYKSLEDIIGEHPDIDTLEELKDYTTVMVFDGGIIIADF